MEKNQIRDLVAIFVVSLFVALIPLAIETQDSIAKSIISTLMFLVFLITIFLFGVPSTRNQLKDRLTGSHISVVLTTLLILPFILTIILGADIGTIILPYLLWYVLPGGISLFVLQSSADLEKVQQMIVTSLIALLYWIGFDHRYTMVLFDNFEGLSYIMSGFWFACLLILFYGYQFGVAQEDNEDDQGLVPTKEGLKYGQISSIVVSFIILPLGLITGFLAWNPSWSGLFDFIVAFIGIFLTIALQEELVFRGVLLQEADSVSEERGIHPLVPLIITSLMFGMTHWNNEVPQYIPHYIILATFAGIAYGWSYRKSGMFGAMLTHTLVDWIWALVFERPGR